MAVANSVTNVSTTRVALTIPANGWVKNNGGSVVFLGGTTVTADSSATGGFTLQPGERIGPFVTGGTLNAIAPAHLGTGPAVVAEIAILSGLA